MSLVELLVGVFDVEQERAEQVAQFTSEAEFVENYGFLEILFGSTTADSLIRDGDVLSYNGPVFQEYLSLARESFGKLGHIVDDESMPIFYSLESLRKYLEGPREERIDFSEVEFFRYFLFDPSNNQSNRYLRSLIEDGCVAVGKREHWVRTGRKLKGAKGLHILTNITAQISRVRDAVDLPRPNYVVNGGQLKLLINDETRDFLKLARDAAYEKHAEASTSS